MKTFEPMRPRRKLAYATLVFGLFFGMAEMGTRVLWSEQPREGELALDRAQQWTLPMEGSVTLAGVRNRINTVGYRGEEFDPTPAPCTARLLAVGDSSLYGHGIPDGQAFAELLPSLLSPEQTGGLDLEVINGGVPGHSTYQAIARLKLDGWDLRPDILLIANLWSDVARVDLPDRVLYKKPVSPGSAWGATDAVFGHSALYRWMRARLTRPRYIYADGIPDGSRFRVPPAEYEANLEFLIAEAADRGATAMLVVMPHSRDVRATMDEWELEQLPAAGEFAGEHRSVIRRVADREGVPLVDFSVPFSAASRPLFIDSVHPNVEGHVMMAHLLAEAVAEPTELFDGAQERCAGAAVNGSEVAAPRVSSARP